jgi:flavin reductase (DIM6/NTAB) family NADH-FMN oxidoreductase RutF
LTLDPQTDDDVPEAVAYRRALGGFATGVCVVTADTAEGPLGVTINSFTSVSLKPRLVLWCMDEGSQRWKAFEGAGRFSIHVLGADDRDMAARFARGDCTLAEGEYDRVGEGAPRLKHAVTRLDCRTWKRVPMGDHIAIVGEVESFAADGGDALVFFRGRYGRMGGDRL